MQRQVRVVTFGGAGGQSGLLRGIANNDRYSITAICTASDSGRDTGKIVSEYGKCGVNGSLGDVGKCLCALSPDRELARSLMHRFDTGSRRGQSVKNTLYLGLIREYGPPLALTEMHRILQIRQNHRVLPVTFAKTHLQFCLVDGTRLSRETTLDNLSVQKLWNLKVHRIRRVWLRPKVGAETEVLKAIAEADYIVVSPGDLFTSIIPVLLVGGVGNAIAQSQARLVVVMNLMTKIGETDGYEAADFLRQLQSHMAKRKPDVVLSNSNSIPEESLQRYRRKEHKVAVVADSLALTEYADVQLIRADLWGKTAEGYIVHDPQKLALALKAILS
jgi:uncharacterized cofD-like protein